MATGSASARTIVLEQHRKVYKSDPRVILGARLNSTWPIAMAGPEGCLRWCDFLRILDLPGKDAWAISVIGEELAHALMIALQHPIYTSDPPNKDRTSPEYQAWDKAREHVMKEEALYRWPFVDRAQHERLTAWAIETKGGLKA